MDTAFRGTGQLLGQVLPTTFSIIAPQGAHSAQDVCPLGCWPPEAGAGWSGRWPLEAGAITGSGPVYGFRGN